MIVGERPQKITLPNYKHQCHDALGQDADTHLWFLPHLKYICAFKTLDVPDFKINSEMWRGRVDKLASLPPLVPLSPLANLERIHIASASSRMRNPHIFLPSEAGEGCSVTTLRKWEAGRDKICKMHIALEWQYPRIFYGPRGRAIINLPPSILSWPHFHDEGYNSSPCTRASKIHLV